MKKKDLLTRESLSSFWLSSLLDSFLILTRSYRDIGLRFRSVR